MVDMRDRPAGDGVEVVFAADDRYAMQLGVTLKSLALTFGTSATIPRSRFERLNIRVIDYGITAENRARLAACIECEPRKPIELAFMAPELQPDTQETLVALQHFTSRLFPDHVYVTPPAMYATLLIPVLVPDLPRVIYLDADLLVMRDIRELWAVDTAGHLLSAVPEYNDQLLSDRLTLSWPLRLGVSLCLRDRMQFQAGRNWTTFNSGVVVFELDLIRRQQPDLAQCLLKEARALMAAHDGLPVFFLDQDIISKHLHNRINLLPDEWNFHDFLPRLVMDHTDYRRAMLRAKIMHYNGPPRPWEPAGRWRPYTRSWYRCLDRTPWAGWRPSYRQARLPRGNGRPVRTTIGGVIIVLGRFRNHFFAEQDARGLSIAPESS